jgi:hypothetical protein
LPSDWPSIDLAARQLNRAALFSADALLGNHRIMGATEKLGVIDCIGDRIRFGIKEPTESERFGNQMKAVLSLRCRLSVASAGWRIPLRDVWP